MRGIESELEGIQGVLEGPAKFGEFGSAVPNIALCEQGRIEWVQPA